MSVKSFCAEVPCARSQSVLARGLHALLPPIEVVKASYCNANPDNPREWEVSPLPTIMSFQNCGILNNVASLSSFPCSADVGTASEKKVCCSHKISEGSDHVSAAFWLCRMG